MSLTAVTLALRSIRNRIRPTKTTWLTLVMLLSVNPTQAHNNYFLPGDAFFSVSLSRKTIKQWTANQSDTFTFDYCRFDGQFMACGNMGYSKLQVKGIDTNFRQALAEAYWRYEDAPIYRQDGENENELTQINSVVALIYNSGFTGPLGLKLNEHWVDQGHGIYSGLIKNDQAVIDDWKLGPQFPPLQLDSAIDPKTHLIRGEGVPVTVDTPLIVTASNIKIYLVGHSLMRGFFPTCPNLEEVHDREAEFVSYFEVTPSDFTKHSLKERYSKWKKETKRIPLDPSESLIPNNKSN